MALTGMFMLLTWVNLVTATIYAGDWIRVAITGPDCDVTMYGAVGDSVTDDTVTVQKAITACTSSSGGTVIFPAGKTFLTTGLTVPFANNVALLIDGTLRFSNNTKTWPKSDLHCLTFLGGVGLVLTGHGLVDGQGAAWWPQRDTVNRPGLVYFKNSNEVLLANLTFRDSPNHNLEMYAGHCEVIAVNVLAPPSTGIPNPSHNTDAIDVHGDYFWIHHSKLAVGDDNVAIHSSHVLVSDCFFGTGHGASIGSLGGDIQLQNITVRDTVFEGTTTGARIKIDTKASGFLKDVTYTNLTMKGLSDQAVILCFFYDTDGCNWPGKPVKTKSMTLQLSNVVFEDITSIDANSVGSITCSSETPCAVTIRNVVATRFKQGWACSNAVLAGGSNFPALPSECKEEKNY